MSGIGEVIVFLLGLAGFGIQPNPKPATPEVALRYALPEADLVVHVDVAAFVPGNYKVLQNLPSSPAIKSAPQLADAAKQIVAKLEGARAMAKQHTGIDFATDISDLTAFVSFPSAGDPLYLVTVRGKIAPNAIDLIATQAKKPAIKVGGGSMIDGGGDPSVGLTRDGVLLVGQSTVVRDRLNESWRAPIRPASTAVGHATEVINGKPVFAVVFAPSGTGRARLLSKLGPEKSLPRDLLARAKLYTFSVYADGVGWAWVDSNPAGVDQMAQLSEGIVDLLRAAQIAPRGLAKFGLAGLESYRGTNKTIDEVLKRKGELQKLVEANTGDGNFKASVAKDPSRLRVDVRLTGKSLSEVIPAGAVVPLLAVTTFGFARSKHEAMESPPPPSVASPPRPPAPPRPVQPVKPKTY